MTLKAVIDEIIDKKMLTREDQEKINRMAMSNYTSFTSSNKDVSNLIQMVIDGTVKVV